MVWSRYRRNKRITKGGRRFVRVVRTVKTHGGAGGGVKTVKMNTILPYVFPDRYTCKLRYACEFTLNPEALAGCTCKTIRANDLYDPEVALGGNQPTGFDQLCLFYNHFTVIGSKIRVVPTFTSANHVNPAYYGVALSATAGEITGYQAREIFSQSNTTRGNQHGILYQIDTSFKPRIMKFSLKKFFNETDASDDQYQCSATASPTEMAYFDIWACAVNQNDSGTLSFIATVDYIVMCHEPKRVIDV